MLNERDAALIAAYAKGLFRMVTDELMAVVRDEMQRLPDDRDEDDRDPVTVGRAMLRALASRSGEENRLNPSAVRREVDAELQRRGVAPTPTPRTWVEPGDMRAYRRSEAELAKAQHEAHEAVVNAWALRLSPHDVADLTAVVLDEIERKSKGARETYRKLNRDVRTSLLLKRRAWEICHG